MLMPETGPITQLASGNYSPQPRFAWRLHRVSSMSDREFENYLALLTRLLRLNRQQSEALSAELRSHMEDRLDELITSGISHNEAVRQALTEFGDAAGLAHHFSDVSINRKRRWVVRTMTFSLAAAFLFALSLIAFWPG